MKIVVLRLPLLPPRRGAVAEAPTASSADGRAE